MPTSLLARMTRRPQSLTPLSGDERVVIFPSLGHLERDGQHWHVHVHGEVFAGAEPGLGKRFLLKLLRRAMKVPEEALDSDIFRRRIGRFLASDIVGRQISVRVNEQLHVLPKTSRRNGHFLGAVRLPASSLPLAESAPGDAVRLALAVCGADAASPAAAGQAFLLPATGTSVISDIDDTLKETEVASKRSLLVNTFLHEFRTIPGMAGLFRGWAEQGAAVHYVSSSPWQLYEHLADHLRTEGFPEGSFHLRAFRLRDHLIRRILMLRRSGKATVIRGILKTFPQRKFILVGDSGEHDPEIYGAMARKFPKQVAGIYIRQLPGPKNTPTRYQRAFRSVRYEVVRLFREAAELNDAAVLPG
jgi:phosphatidate phosphatase APP1